MTGKCTVMSSAVSAGAALFASIALGEGSALLPPASCYSQRGLVLQLDGRENVGAGLDYNPDATVWKDLSPSGNDANLTANGDFEAGEFGLQLKNSADGIYYAARTKDNMTVGLTAECLVKPTGGDANMNEAVWAGGGSVDGLSIPFPCARYQSTHKILCFDDNAVYWKSVTPGNTYQFSLRSADGVSWTAYNDGVASSASYAPGAKLVENPLALGGIGTDNRRLTGTLYAMRVYDRPLRAEELKANAIMDHVRFEGADPTAATWPEGFRYEPTTGKILVRVQISAQSGLLVSVDGGEPTSSFDEWIVRGESHRVEAVSGEADFESWQDSADELTGDEKRSATLDFVADFPRRLSAISAFRLPPASCYSQRGLVLHLDGRENVGAGLDYNPDATVWKDLSPSGNDANLTANGDFEAGKFGLQLKNSASGIYYAAKTKDNMTVGMTAECLVKPTGGDDGMNEAVWAGGGSVDGLYIPFPCARFSPHEKKFCFDDTTISWKTGVVLGNIYQFSLRSTDGDRWTGYNDGVASGGAYAPGTKLVENPLALGGIGTANRRLTGTLYAMRVYNRPLRAEELKANAIMDHVRFEGADPLTAAWPEGFRYEPTTGEIQVHVQISAESGIRVSVDGGEPTSSFDEWIVRGKSYGVVAVPESTKVTFTAWQDSAGELTEAESKSLALELVADVPRRLVAAGEKTRRAFGRGDWRRFKYESKITFQNCGVAATTPEKDVPVLLRISSGCPAGINLADIALDGSDLAFVSCPDGAWLDFNVDAWGFDGGCVWVRVPSLSEKTAIKMYWGLKEDCLPGLMTDTNVWAKYTTVLHMNEGNTAQGNRVDSTQKNAFGVDADISLSEGVVGFAAKSSAGGSVRVAKGGPWEQTLVAEAMTLSMWLRVDATSDQYPFFAQWGSGSMGAGLWMSTMGGRPSDPNNGAVFWHGGNRTDADASGPSKANDAGWPEGSTCAGKWLHYVCTCSNANGVAHTVYYIDGHKVKELDTTIQNGKSTLFSAPATASDLCLVNGPAHSAIVTQMDEFRLSGGVRTPEEVALDYQIMTRTDFATFGARKAAAAPNPGLVFMLR